MKFEDYCLALNFKNQNQFQDKDLFHSFLSLELIM